MSSGHWAKIPATADSTTYENKEQLSTSENTLNSAQSTCGIWVYSKKKDPIVRLGLKEGGSKRWKR
jgi:hypothetical protein